MQKPVQKLMQSCLFHQTVMRLQNVATGFYHSLVPKKNCDEEQIFRRKNCVIRGLSQFDATKFFARVFARVFAPCNLSLRNDNQRCFCCCCCTGGSVMDSISQAIQDASAVVVCVSEKYRDSPNCRAGKQQSNCYCIPIL